MTLHVKSGGVWKEVKDPSVKSGGVWKPVSEGWVKDAGTWKKFYQRVTVYLTPIIDPTTYIVATLYVRRNGTLSLLGLPSQLPDYNPSDQWLSYGATSTIGDQYEAQLVYVSGLYFTGSSMDTWLSITDLEWSTSGQGPHVATLEIRKVGAVSAEASVAIQITPTL